MSEVLKEVFGRTFFSSPSSIMHCKFNYNAFITNLLLAMIYLPKMVTIIHFYHYLLQVKWWLSKTSYDTVFLRTHFHIEVTYCIPVSLEIQTRGGR